MASHLSAMNTTSEHRALGVSTDDAAIFIEDTVDKTTAQCITPSGSAVAILSPQRMPLGVHVDVTEYDSENIGSSSSAKKTRTSQKLGDVSTNSTNCRLSFGKSPNPKGGRMSGGVVGRGSSHSLNTSGQRSSHSRKREADSPSSANLVPLSELEAVERDRNRYQKMYEHQKALYEDMADKYSDTYDSLQDKIVEVVALSTRNEESKRFIRQLKKELSENRVRVMDIQNKALQETKQERITRERYEQLIDEQEIKHERTVERYESKLTGMETLLKDLTSIKSEEDKIHISQLDALLKASYAKNSALFNDLLRQSRQIDLMYDSKMTLEREIDQLRRDKKELEVALIDERRHMMNETERFIEQTEEQQQSIINLRQMLIRAMDHGYGDEDEEDYDEESCSTDDESTESDLSDDNDKHLEEKENEKNPDGRDTKKTSAPLSSVQPLIRSSKGVTPASSSIPASSQKASTTANSAETRKEDIREKNRPLLSALIRNKVSSVESETEGAHPLPRERNPLGTLVRTSEASKTPVDKENKENNGTIVKKDPCKLKNRETENPKIGLCETKKNLKQRKSLERKSESYEKEKRVSDNRTADDETDDVPRLMNFSSKKENTGDKENAFAMKTHIVKTRKEIVSPQ